MKAAKTFYLSLLLLTLTLTSCHRNREDVWEDSKSAKRHITRGFRTLGGKSGDSRAVYCREDFMPKDDNYYTNQFVPLEDQYYSNDAPIGEYVSPQPRMAPGDPGCTVPGIDAFQDPSMDPALSGIFRNVYFEYNSNLVKGQDNLNIIRDIANHMRQRPNMYVFVEGHCDERGPEAYNLALGSRRSNAIRNLLVQEGVNPDNVFSISYGKERPLIHEHHEEAWAQNRRVEFKTYQR